MSDWQPIETAPKDRVILLYGTIEAIEDQQDLYTPTPKRIAGYWDVIDGDWCSTCSTWLGPWVKATHWMPLPEPPHV